MVARGTTAAVSPSMTTRKGLFSQITVAGVLRCRAGVEQGLAVAAAEQEDEPFQVAA